MRKLNTIYFKVIVTFLSLFYLVFQALYLLPSTVHATKGRHAQTTKPYMHLIPGDDLPIFSLKTRLKRNYTNQSLLGHWTFVVFAYSDCPFICPIALSNISTMYQQIDLDNSIAQPVVIVISTRPSQDRPNQFQHVVQAFNPSFLGLIGDKPTLKRLMNTLIKPLKNNPLIALNSSNPMLPYLKHLWIINPHGKVVGIFPYPYKPAVLMKYYEQLTRSDDNREKTL